MSNLSNPPDARRPARIYYRGWYIYAFPQGAGQYNVALRWAWPDLVPLSHGVPVAYSFIYSALPGMVNPWEWALDVGKTQIDAPATYLVTDLPDPDPWPAPGTVTTVDLRPAPPGPAIPTKTEPKPGHGAPLPYTDKTEVSKMAETTKPSWFWTFIVTNWKTTWTALGAAIALVLTQVAAAGDEPLGTGRMVAIIMEALAVFAAGLFARDANKTSELSIGRAKVIQQKQAMAFQEEINQTPGNG